MTELAAHRAALQARQGQGARYDAANAPAAGLDRARRATAGFARHLNGIADRDLAGPCAEPVARLCLEARAMSHCLAGLAAGASPSLHVTKAEVAQAATLPPHALRHLFAHTVVHLNTEWRDLDGAHWDAALCVEGAAVPVSSLPDLRAYRLCAAGLHPRDWPAGVFDPVVCPSPEPS